MSNNALVRRLGDRTFGALAAVSMISGAAASTSAQQPVQSPQLPRAHIGATFGNLPTLFSTPADLNFVAATIFRRSLSNVEQGIVRRAIARTAKLVSKGRLLVK